MRKYTGGTSDGVWWLLSDHLGSTSLAYKTDGTEVLRQYYYPWGNLRGSSEPTVPTDVGYTGQRLDVSTELMFYNARYYDPLTGRFTAADTIVPDPANPQHLNRYSYVSNNPINLIDPTGHEECGYRVFDGEHQYVCWNEGELAGGASWDEAAAPASDPTGRCQGFCQKYDPARADELREASRAGGIDWGGVLLEVGQTAAVVIVAAGAFAVCSGGALACLLLAAGGAGSLAEVGTGLAIACIDDGCRSYSWSDAGSDAFEGYVTGVTGAGVNSLTAAAAGSSKPIGLLGAARVALRSGLTVNESIVFVESVVRTTAAARAAVWVTRALADAGAGWLFDEPDEE